MFNIVSSVRPVVAIDSPAFYKGNTFQVAVAATVPLSEKDVPLMVAILSPLESNQQRTLTEVFSGYQELSTDEQEQTILNVGGLGWVSDHSRLTTSNEKKDAYQAAMEEVMIPASALGEIGDDQYPNLVLFADTLEATSPENVQSYFSADCAYLIVEPSRNGKGNSYKIQSRGPVAGEDDSFSMEGTDGGTFAIASSKKELKQLMKSDADVVYDERKDKLFLNDNGTKKVGGLVAKFKGKPKLSTDLFDQLTAHGGDDITGEGDIKDQIATFREGLSDADESKLYGETLINPTKGIKRIRKAAKKEGYSFDKAELGDALNEMDQAGEFFDVELDDAALASLLNSGGAIGQNGSIEGC